MAGEWGGVGRGVGGGGRGRRRWEEGMERGGGRSGGERGEGEGTLFTPCWPHPLQAVKAGDHTVAGLIPSQILEERYVLTHNGCGHT